MSGVGNIYADESLFRAGIRPRRRAATLTREQLRKLHASLQEVLHEAISLGGSSVSDYVDADGKEGFFQLQHRVYGREGEPCLVCGTPIKRVVISGRSSHYCSHCQKYGRHSRRRRLSSLELLNSACKKGRAALQRSVYAPFLDVSRVSTRRHFRAERDTRTLKLLQMLH